jgi:hypothetical protein
VLDNLDETRAILGSAYNGNIATDGRVTMAEKHFKQLGLWGTDKSSDEGPTDAVRKRGSIGR